MTRARYRIGHGAAFGVGFVVQEGHEEDDLAVCTGRGGSFFGSAGGCFVVLLFALLFGEIWGSVSSLLTLGTMAVFHGLFSFLRLLAS